MRILHTGDWHLGKNIEGKSRLEEQELFLNDFIQMVKEKDVDLVLIAGDIYDSGNPSAKAEKLFYDTLKKLSENGERLILVIAGNHDSPERLVAAGPLAMEHGIIMVGTPKTVVQTGDYGKHKVVQAGEGFVEIAIKEEKAVIITVPYPSEKRLNEILYESMDTEQEQLQSYSERIKRLFSDLQQNYREDTINLAISHLFAMGSQEGGSEKGIQLGGSYILPPSCLPLQAQYIALGHIHKPQIVPDTEKKARYAGSPIHYNKKEINFKKQCWLIEAKVGEPCEITEIPIPIYKPIEIWKCDSIEDAIQQCEENAKKNCWVYLEIKTNRYVREDESKKMKSFKDDILEIAAILPEVSEEQQPRESLSEQSFEELFRAFYKYKGAGDLDDNSEMLELLRGLMEEGENSETN